MVEQIHNLTQYNWLVIVTAIVVAMLAFKFLSDLFEWFVKKFGIETKSMRQKREDHDLLITTSKNLIELQNKHVNDEKNIRNDFKEYMQESREDRKLIHGKMDEYAQNRVSDRKQSLAIQKELTDSIKEITKGQSDRDKQIEALMEGSKELLGDTIDQRYNKYIQLKGIPQNEVDEFDAIYNAYRGLKGNHGRETKYKYVKNHLPVLPVKTEVIIDD
jgi:hypothetical protein